MSISMHCRASRRGSIRTFERPRRQYRRAGAPSICSWMTPGYPHERVETFALTRTIDEQARFLAQHITVTSEISSLCRTFVQISHAMPRSTELPALDSAPFRLDSTRTASGTRSSIQILDSRSSRISGLVRGQFFENSRFSRPSRTGLIFQSIDSNEKHVELCMSALPIVRVVCVGFATQDANRYLWHVACKATIRKSYLFLKSRHSSRQRTRGALAANARIRPRSKPTKPISGPASRLRNRVSLALDVRNQVH